MSYYLLDKTGYAGDVGTSKGMAELHEAAKRRMLQVVTKFLETGELLALDVKRAVDEMKGLPEFNGLRALVEDGQPPFTITDGVIDEAVEPLTVPSRMRQTTLFTNQEPKTESARPKLRQGVEQYAKALRSALGPLIDRVRKIAEIEDPKAFANALEKLQKDLPKFAKVSNKGLVDAMTKAMIGSAVKGLVSRTGDLVEADKEAEGGNQRVDINVNQRETGRKIKKLEFRHDDEGKVTGATIVEEPDL